MGFPGTGVAFLKTLATLSSRSRPDALVYAAAAGLVSASLEHIGYVLQYIPDVMLVRAPISTLGHLVLSCICGYAYGLH